MGSWMIGRLEIDFQAGRRTKVSEYILRSDDPAKPRERIVVATNACFGELIDVTDEVATSGSTRAQTSEVHDRLVLTRSQAAWLRDVLIVMQVDGEMCEHEVNVARARLASNPLAVER